MEKRAKAHLILIFSMNTDRESVAYRSFEFVESLSKRCQKSYHRDNWLVAAKRS